MKTQTKNASESLPNDQGVPIQVLIEIYENLKKDDPKISLRLKNLDKETDAQIANVKTVDRRAPLHYLIPTNDFRKKADPALSTPSLQGKLITLLTTTSALILIYFQILVYTASRRNNSDSSIITSKGVVFFELGGLHTNAIREGEWFRLFWAAWLHSGWFHLGFNVISQIQFFLMFEPDWGPIRCFFIFFIAGIGGNFVSAVADPCSLTVGSSGGLFGLIGAIFVFCAEYWYTIPRPLCIISFSLIILAISIIDGFIGNTDNWAHMGGLYTGMAVALLTLNSFTLVKTPVKPSKPPKPITTTWGRVKVTLKSALVPSQWTFRKIDWFFRALGFAMLVKYVIVNLVVQLTVFIPCPIYLYVKYDYQPLGNVRFKNSIKCVCCYSNTAGIENPKNNGVPYYCFEATSQPSGWSMDWRQFCSLDTSAIPSYNLPAINSIGVPA